jgi:hypothetical protein
MSEQTLNGAPYEPFPAFEAFATEHVDLASYDSAAATFSVLKDTAGAEALQRAVDTATRWAAVDTGAIEGLYTVDRGFTMSVAASAAALDNAHLVVGDDVARAIKDAVAGYEFVLDVATKQREASEIWIKELHQVLCASQETYRVLTDNGPEERPLIKGAYKELPNSPVNLETGVVHSYAPPLDTPVEMGRLIEELRSEAFSSAHPIMQAAYAHYAFVCIHPFPDGNGRVARALASTYLYRHPGVPLVIFADQKGAYIDALEAADRGEVEPLVGFVRERAIDTMMMVATTMQRPVLPDPAERIAHLNKVMRSDSGLAHTEIDALLTRVKVAWVEALGRAFEIVQPPLSSAIRETGTQPAQPGYRVLGNLNRSVVQISSAAPASASTTKVYGYQIARPGTSEADFAIFDESTNGTTQKICEVLLREVNPTVSPALTYRLDALAADVVSEMIDTVVQEGEQTLRNAGYIS